MIINDIFHLLLQRLFYSSKILFHCEDVDFQPLLLNAIDVRYY